MIRTSTAVLALVTGCCTPLKQHKLEIAAETTVIALLAVDALESVTITDRCVEANPIIGNCGQRVPVEFYFPLVMTAHAVGAVVLPHQYRPWWIGIVMGLEAATVWETTQLGYRP